MECEAIKRVRNDMGLTNVEIMVPSRTVKQAQRVVGMLAERGRPSGASGRRHRRPARHHDVRGPSNAILGRAVPRALSTACRSARTT